MEIFFLKFLMKQPTQGNKFKITITIQQPNNKRKNMSSQKDYIIEQLKKRIEEFKTEAKTEKVGTVVEIGDGIAKISGLSDVVASEMLVFKKKTLIIFNIIKNKKL